MNKHVYILFTVLVQRFVSNTIPRFCTKEKTEWDIIDDIDAYF